MFTAARIAAMMASLSASGSPAVTEPVAATIIPAAPAFVLGAGDALGCQIRVNDVLLARRRGGGESARHAAVMVADDR